MIYLSWNIRGLGAKVKRSALRKLITTNEPTFVAIQETKLEDIPSKLIRTIWKHIGIEWIFCPSIGSSGGIASLWSSTAFTMTSNTINRNWIAVHGTILAGNHECTILNIYNPCSVEGRAVVWNEIIEYRENFNTPCILMGDFNEVLTASERGSRLASQTGMTNFQSFIQDCKWSKFPAMPTLYGSAGTLKARSTEYLLALN